jgi:type I restriction enzyme S subunit
MGKVIVASEPCITNQQINSIKTDNPDMGHYLYYYFKSIYSDLRNMAIGSSTMLMINKTEFENIPVLEPDSITVHAFAQVNNIFDQNIKNKSHETKALNNFQTILLSGLATKCASTKAEATA